MGDGSRVVMYVVCSHLAVVGVHAVAATAGRMLRMLVGLLSHV